MMQFQPKDVIALTTVLAIILLVAFKANHSFDAILALVIGFYFGHRVSGIDTGK